jgi:hypothetical protein
MEGLIAIRFRVSDKILNTALFRAPEAVDMAKSDIAIGSSIDKDTKSDKIMNLANIGGGLKLFKIGKIPGRAKNLLIKAIEMLHASGDLSFNGDERHFLAEDTADAFDIGAPLFAFEFNNRADPGKAIGFKELEGEIIQFRFHARHAQATGERGIDLACLKGHIQDLLRIGLIVRGADHAHSVEAIGKFKKDDPRVFGHSDKHLANRLSLLAAHSLADARFFTFGATHLIAFIGRFFQS